MSVRRAFFAAKLGSKQRIMYKKIGKSCDKINASSKSDSEVKKCKSESEYQRISDATSQNIKALVHETRSSPSSPKGKNKGKLPPKQTKKKVREVFLAMWRKSNVFSMKIFDCFILFLVFFLLIFFYYCSDFF